MFGTYVALDAPATFGVDRPPARPYNPFYLQLYLWADLVRDTFRRRPAG